ncbi:DUF445 domain-containing protein [Pseudoramibacter sp.]|jgi:uncharacterized membrane protein YheB (UPF0754 family)|uniref:DUF445 domain-containing protein n=1 Tax=Pseudoramibacter sp. TaxID=2034862 RepID=UPI0025D0428D|nr:DUF445 family protein [Pseudoramibacter sp.]MCH4073029.1 DUF445 family protein [Pseudoramibacter sp.]MCH4106800.1 DUF445 family protein [Pseudoramibacter sp.]
MHILKLISGPLIGALIGYFTNFIAVKMLFFPKKEVRLFGHRLPFTPGAIPKGRKRLARKAGDVIAKRLITKEAIVSRMVEPEFEDAMVNQVEGLLNRSIEEMAAKAQKSELAVQELKDKTASELTASVMRSLQDVDFEALVREKGIPMIRQKLSGSLVGAFVTDNMLNNVVTPIASAMRTYIDEDGQDMVEARVREKVDHLFAQSPEDLLQCVDITKEQMQSEIRKKYRAVVDRGVEELLTKISVSDIVADAIDSMSVDELEEMVLSVMKKEFDVIINLGALIGFVLGLLNLVV